jgi:hypothetical protein
VGLYPTELVGYGGPGGPDCGGRDDPGPGNAEYCAGVLKLSGLEIGGNAPGPDDADCGEVKDGRVGCEDGGTDIGDGWRAFEEL